MLIGPSIAGAALASNSSGEYIETECEVDTSDSKEAIRSFALSLAPADGWSRPRFSVLWVVTVSVLKCLHPSAHLEHLLR